MEFDPVTAFVVVVVVISASVLLVAGIVHAVRHASEQRDFWLTIHDVLDRRRVEAEQAVARRAEAEQDLADARTAPGTVYRSRLARSARHAAPKDAA